MYLFFSFLGNCCCCFSCMLARNGYLRKNARRYYKFRLALDRLAGEKDIRRILYMNRINSLIHKSIFMSRQRKAINYGKRFVISDRQLEEAQRKSRSRKNSKTSSRDREGRMLLPDEKNYMNLAATNIDKILDDFDPNTNEQDRRILYEVTGMRM